MAEEGGASGWGDGAIGSFGGFPDDFAEFQVGCPVFPGEVEQGDGEKRGDSWGSDGCLSMGCHASAGGDAAARPACVLDPVWPHPTMAGYLVLLQVSDALGMLERSRLHDRRPPYEDSPRRCPSASTYPWVASVASCWQRSCFPRPTAWVRSTRPTST
jgi:hypothetical protein